MKSFAVYKKLLALSAAAVLGAVSLTACSEAGDGSSGTAGKDQPTIGILQFTSHSSLDNCYEGLIEGLKAAGYTDGETCTIDFKNAQGSTTTADTLASNMAAKKYDMIIGIATPAAMSAVAAAKEEIPVVFCAVSDPMAESAKLVNSLEKTGVNCTGSSDRLNLEGQLKMIRAFQPGAKKIGILVLPKRAASLVKKSERIRTFTPEQNQKADAYLFQYRLYYDLFVKNSLKSTIYTYTY